MALSIPAVLLLVTQRARLVLKLITDFLNYFQLLVVAPEEHMVEYLSGFRSQLGVLLDHHHNHMLEFLGPLLNQVQSHFFQVKLVIENVFLPFKPLSKGMVAPGHQIKKDAAKTEDVYLLSFPCL